LLLSSHQAGHLGDEIRLAQSANTATINVTHKMGIGAVKVILEKGRWPRKIKLVLKGFKSLENATICGGEHRFEFSSKKVGKDHGQATLFVPPEILTNRPQQIDFSWVDAYR
jgi:hypothetical protein